MKEAPWQIRGRGVNPRPRIQVPPKPGETMGAWAYREVARMEDAENTVNNRIQKRRRKDKLAKTSRKKNRGK